MNLDLTDDFVIFDGLITLTALHQDNDTVSINFTDTTFNCTRVETVLTDKCLVRQISERETGTVRQLFERGKSVLNDEMQMLDTVIEVFEPTVILKPGDSLLKKDDAGHTIQTWEVLAVDLATLGSRLRCGCRSI